MVPRVGNLLYAGRRPGEDMLAHTVRQRHRAHRHELVVAARDDEIKGISKCGVWDKVPLEECYKNTGKAPVGTRWIDINKGDITNPVYRSRLVGKEFNEEKVLRIFSATPPLEALKILLSTAATMEDYGEEDKVIMVNDVSRAFFEAPAVRQV